MSRLRGVCLGLIGSVAVIALGACADEDVESETPAAAPAGPDSGGVSEAAATDAPVETCRVGALAPGKVGTTGGIVAGAKVGSSWSWRGIPFATPPLGALRWKPPVPVACAAGERDATKVAPECAQLTADGAYAGSEDCLTVNVWAPENAKDAPVLFFVHGGGNTRGSASDPIYDGAAIAAKTGAVVVTTQYRLGVMGFLAHPELDAESADKVSGNYGILDQIAALRWVRDNIAAFGGAAARVLLFGESGGAQDVLVHVASPLSKGLFAAAAIESGGVYTTTLSSAEAAMKGIPPLAGCNGPGALLSCLRSASVESLVMIPSAEGPLDKSSPLRYGPVIDGHVLAASSLAVIETGAHNHVPVIIGTNRDETSRMVPKVATDAEYEAAVRAQYGVAGGNVLLSLYPASAFASPRAALVRLTTDATWTCPIRRLARAIAQHQTEPVYRYYFTWSSPGVAGASVGATHGLELPFVFGTLAALPSVTAGPEALDLSTAIQSHWVAFAAAGSPDVPGRTPWPRYDVATDPYLELGTPIRAAAGLATVECDAMDAFVQ